MDKMDFNAAFDPVKAPVEVRQKVLQREGNGHPALPFGKLAFRLGSLAAVVAAVVLTVLLWPAFFGGDQVHGHNMTIGADVDGFITENLTGKLLIDRDGWLGQSMSRYYGAPCTLLVPEELFPGMTVTMDISLKYGEFSGDQKNEKYKTDPEAALATLDEVYLGQNFTIDNGEKIYWSYYDIKDRAKEAGISHLQYMDQLGNRVEVRIVIRADGHIVGYGLLEIRNDGECYAGMLVESVCFPQVDGQFQTVTEEDIEAIFAKITTQ